MAPQNLGCWLLKTNLHYSSHNLDKTKTNYNVSIISIKITLASSVKNCLRNRLSVISHRLNRLQYIIDNKLEILHYIWNQFFFFFFDMNPFPIELYKFYFLEKKKQQIFSNLFICVVIMDKYSPWKVKLNL